MKFVSVEEHYDLLVKEGNDPFHDPPALENYMDKWDGQAFLDALSLVPSSCVLEIGIGTGRLAKKVLTKGCHSLTGIDISPLSIEQAKLNLAQWNNISFITDDFLKYNFQQKFDIIYCSLTFFHIQDKKAAIDKIAKLLNHGGRFVLSLSTDVSDILDYGSRAVKLFPDSLSEIIELITLNDLSVENILPIDHANIIVAKNNLQKF